MKPSTRRPAPAAALGALVLVALTPFAQADPGHEDGDEGAMKSVAARTSESVRAGFTVAGRLRLSGVAGDLAYFDHGGRIGPYVYVGAYVDFAGGERRCPAGVRIVSVSRPGAPRLVATAGGLRDVTYEDVEVRRIGRRVVLAVGIQRCQPEGQNEGLALYDVTTPSRPSLLSFWRSPGRGVHELDFVVRPDGRALALVATPHSERESLRLHRDLGGDFRVIDVTDPRRPVQLSEWGIVADSSLRQAGGGGEITSTGAGIGGYATYYGHSVRGADAGMTAYVSYWDAGVLKFDIRDPRNPRPLGRTAVAPDGEGDAHSVAILDTGGQRYLFQSQEEVDPLSPPVVTSTATGARHLPALELSWAPRVLSQIGSTSAPVLDARAGCAQSDFTGASGKLALVDAPDPLYLGRIEGWKVPCDVGLQALLAARGGAIGLLVNFVGPDRPTIFRFLPGPEFAEQLRGAAPRFFAVAISSIDGGAETMRAALGAGGDVRVSLVPQRPAYGGIGVHAESRPTPSPDGTPEFPLAGSFVNVPGTVGAVGRGPIAGGTEWINAHNVEVRGRRAFASWYAGGIVALDVRDPARIRRTGQFAPRGVSFWGVDADARGSLVFGSDMASGLWILRPPG